MGDSFLAQKLPGFTNPTHEAPECHQPFVLTVGGHPWSLAADGAWVFAVRGTSSFAQGEARELFTKLLSAVPKAPVEVSTAKLKAWVGQVPSVRVFGEEGRHEGAIFGHLFDLRRLACLLEPIPFPKLALWDATKVVGVRCLGMESKGKWRGFLAALDGDPEVEHRVFDFRPEGAEAFDMMGSLTQD